MSCAGLEHLSNCHGEVTSFVLLMAGVGYWFRVKFATYRFMIKDWMAKRKVSAAKQLK